MGILGYIFPTTPHEHAPFEPRLGTPAKLVVVLDRPRNLALPDDLTGTFTLWCDSSPVVTNRPLLCDGPSAEVEGVCTLHAALTGNELAVAGRYQWAATIHSATLDATLTVAGDFRLTG